MPDEHTARVDTTCPKLLGRLTDLQSRPRGGEVLVDLGAHYLGGVEEWVRIRKISPRARFPVQVTIPGHGAGSYLLGEIRDVREFTRAAR